MRINSRLTDTDNRDLEYIPDFVTASYILDFIWLYQNDYIAWSHGLQLHRSPNLMRTLSTIYLRLDFC